MAMCWDYVDLSYRRTNGPGAGDGMSHGDTMASTYPTGVTVGGGSNMKPGSCFNGYGVGSGAYESASDPHARRIGMLIPIRLQDAHG